ncbi:uncharacterized protein FIESC28_03130 [Fusarium coffeatum]|uniref:Uncharacterized protein n=1 Tax=Fusarium coffeatum TaxID=231269 RepID=A0A366S3X1_9HYPO|nr:uncharacterized protein FIESC28_03130 [Fusarium coffeatum]RBR24017.1 hypothetical protein FIESC28_03130 [Fusarium coffeatum]
MAPIKSDRPKRLQMLGTASLLALLIGGLILILVGVNALANYSALPEPDDASVPYLPIGYNKSAIRGQAALKVGREWGIQVWIAITGVAFALLSFGFAEAYMQIFDSWSSRQAQRGNGLNYARYLNSQPRAPVLYGIRGFPAFVTLRYTIIVMGIAASIGYKFAFVTPKVRVIENIDHRTIRFTGHRLGMVYNNNKNEFSDTTPWITDFPLYNISRSFAHFYQRDNDSVSGVRTDLPPNMLIMSGHASCVPMLEPHFKYGEAGNIATRELALVANGSAPEGEFTMTEDKGEWQRTEISNSSIFDPPQNAIIEFRMSKFAELQIQWAKAPEDSSGTWEVPVVNRSQYNIDMAVVQVIRVVKNLDCKTMAGSGGDGVGIRALNNKGSFMNYLQTSWRPILQSEQIGREVMNVTRKIPEFTAWLEPLIKIPDATLLTAVSAIIRAIMVCHEEGPGTTKILFNDGRYFEPFGEERDPFSDMYPGTSGNFFVGYRKDKYVGCYVSAAIIFVVLGCIAIMVAIFRVWLGPPALTSWMGQHIYLAHTEAISLSGKATGLASGYQVAERDLGRLRLYTQKREEAGAMLKHDRGEGSEGQSSRERDSENRGIITHEDDIGMRERERDRS